MRWWTPTFLWCQHEWKGRNRDEISPCKFSKAHPVDSVNIEETLTPQVPWIITTIHWCKSHLSHSFLHHPKGPEVLQPRCWLPTHHRSIMPQHHRPECWGSLSADCCSRGFRTLEVAECSWISSWNHTRAAQCLSSAEETHTLPTRLFVLHEDRSQRALTKSFFRVADNADYMPPSHSLFHMGICWLIN